MKEAIRKVIRVESGRLSDLDISDQRLVVSALGVRLNAQAPYSNFWVGVAIRNEEGKIFTGCNAERCTYTQSTHAEQSAVDTMIAECGPVKICGLAVVAAPKSVDFDNLNNEWPSEPIMPCGHCLQIIWENCMGDDKVPIINFLPNGEIFIATIGDLLPIRFGPEDLGVDLTRRE